MDIHQKGDTGGFKSGIYDTKQRRRSEMGKEVKDKGEDAEYRK